MVLQEITLLQEQHCDSVGYSGELKDREWIQKLEPKETFDVEYKIIIE